MPVPERFKVSVTENSDNYKKYGGGRNASTDPGDGATDRLLPRPQDATAMDTGSLQSNFRVVNLSVTPCVSRLVPFDQIPPRRFSRTGVSRWVGGCFLP